MNILSTFIKLFSKLDLKRNFLQDNVENAWASKM